MATPTLNLFDSFQTFHPSREELMEVYRRHCTGRGIPKSQPLRELQVDVVLSPEQAQAGGRLPFEIPIARTCEICQGSGRTGFYHCDGCDGGGLLWENVPLDVLLPRPVRDGTVVPISLQHLGVRNLYLKLRVLVAQA